jgi:hypothetical protein
VVFLDQLFQAEMLPERGDTLRLPTRLRYMRIDPVRHARCVSTGEDGVSTVAMFTDLRSRGRIAGGVEMRDLTAQTVQRRMINTAGKVCPVLFARSHACSRNRRSLNMSSSYETKISRVCVNDRCFDGQMCACACVSRIVLVKKKFISKRTMKNTRVRAPFVAAHTEAERQHIVDYTQLVTTAASRLLADWSSLTMPNA